FVRLYAASQSTVGVTAGRDRGRPKPIFLSRRPVDCLLRRRQAEKDFGARWGGGTPCRCPGQPRRRVDRRRPNRLSPGGGWQCWFHAGLGGGGGERGIYIPRPGGQATAAAKHLGRERGGFYPQHRPPGAKTVSARCCH